MSGQFTIRGLPRRLTHDAWWLTDTPNPARVDARPIRGLGAKISDGKAALLTLLILIALADVSFWGQTPGLSVAVFCLGLSAAMVAFKPVRATPREWAYAMGFALICNLPVIEQAQPVSLAFSLGGIVVLLGWVAQGRVMQWSSTARVFARASGTGLALLPRRINGKVRACHTRSDWQAFARAYALPAGLALVFVALFAMANPLAGRALSGMAEVGPLRLDAILRMLFWGGLACVLWPYLNTHALRRDPSAFTLPDRDLSAGYLNRASLRLSLVLFNAIFAVQTISDLSILTGGVSLPEGMSYAEYAHRGAYPLMVTALLAGLFAALTHRLVAEDERLRWLVYGWLGQTLVLVCTAAIRLDLYVGAYGLTHLRIAAFIWMGLIALGLVLVLFQVAQSRPLGWLIRWNAAAAVATLYLCCFVNFTHIIADHNLSADLPDGRLDMHYLCGLGEQVIPAMWDYGPVNDEVTCGTDGRPAVTFQPIESWQEWGFRRWRLDAYLTAHHDL